MILRKIARPLLASAFVAAGVEALRADKTQSRAAQPILDGGLDALPGDVSPVDAATVLRVNGAVQIGGGLLLATGRAPRLASAVLAGTLVPTTAYDSTFWTEQDPVLLEAKKVALIKNVGLLGGVLIASADTEGKPSLAWRGRRRADHVKQAVVAALPVGAAATTSAWDRFVDTAQTDAKIVGEHSAELAETARDRLSDAASTVADRAPGLLDEARSRATELAGKVSDRAPELVEQARDQAESIAEQIADRAPVVADRARELAEDAGAKAASEGRRLRRRYRG